MNKMKNKKLIYGFLVVLTVVLIGTSGCINDGGDVTPPDSKHGEGEEVKEDVNKSEDEIIGGDRDEHGCIGSAGYTWCASKQKCLRTWEEECPDVDMNEDLCRSAGGNWNNCSNKCRIDNQGKESVACTMQCEALCECGGLAGFGCPKSYTCKLPGGIADALGRSPADEGAATTAVPHLLVHAVSGREHCPPGQCRRRLRRPFLARSLSLSEDPG